MEEGRGWLRRLMERADLRLKPRRYAEALLATLLISCIGIAALVSLAVHGMISLMCFTLSAVILSLPPVALLLYPVAAVRRRVSECERELPFVAEFLAMAAAAGLSPTYAFTRLKHFKSLKRFSREVSIAEKLRVMYALSPADSLLEYARRHPSRMVKDFIAWVAAVERSGGEVYKAIHEKATSIMVMLENKIVRLPDQFNFVSSIEILAFVLMPLSLLGLSSIFGSSGVEIALLSSILLPPVFAAAISVLIDSIYPKELSDAPSYKWLLLASLMTTAIALMASTRLPLCIAVGVALVVGGLPAALIYHRWESRRSLALLYLSSIARDIAEEAKKGKSPTQALRAISSSAHYPKPVNELLRRMAAYPLMGVPLKEAVAREDIPWIVKVFFELLDEAEDMGSDPKTLDSLASFFERLSASLRLLNRHVKVFRVGALICSFIMAFSLVFTVNTVIYLMAKVRGYLALYQGGSLWGISPPSPEQAALMRQITYTGIIVNSALLGLLSGKTRTGSITQGLVDMVLFTAGSMTVLALSDKITQVDNLIRLLGL